MVGSSKPRSEAVRLEQLWAGGFGDEYTHRNLTAGRVRAAFWRDLLSSVDVCSVLEVGCNLGGNLVHVSMNLASAQIAGLDVNADALDRLQRDRPEIHLVLGQARCLPFCDRAFDLVFTVGVLIHQPESTLADVMTEILRCSRRYVLCAEYAAGETEEVEYREHRGALFKRDYRSLYLDLAPRMEVEAEGFLGPEQGFDDLTWQLFSVPSPPAR